MNILYCPSCGKKTLQETDDEDYEAGTRHICLSCGAAYWMSPAKSVEVIVEPDPHDVFQPVMPDIAWALEALNSSFLMSRLVVRESVLENLAAYKGKYERAIKFRRYDNSPAKEDL